MQPVLENELVIHELIDLDGAVMWDVWFLGRSIASTYNRRQLDALIEATARPVRWVVPEVLPFP